MLKSLEVRQHGGQGAVVTLTRAGDVSLSLSFPDYKMGRREDNTECLASSYPSVNPDLGCGLKQACSRPALSQEPDAEGTYSSAIMSPWGCFMCLAMAASASSTYSSFSESDTFCRVTSWCSGCRPSCSRARSWESQDREGFSGGRGRARRRGQHGAH